MSPFRHVLALLVTLGFFGIVYLVVPKTVDLTDPTVSLFVGQVIGLCNGLAIIVASSYFGIPAKSGNKTVEPPKENDERTG